MSDDDFQMRPIIDTTIQQQDGSLAARFEKLLDLYAPMTEQADGTIRRDPAHGIISREDFIRLMDTPTGGKDDE